MGEAKRRQQAGHTELPSGRFIFFCMFRKPGDVWLQAHLITPWPKDELTEPQRQATEETMKQFVVIAREHFDEADDEDMVIRQSWLNVPRDRWSPCPTLDEVDELLATTDRLVVRYAATASETGPLVSFVGNGLRPSGPLN